MVGFYKSNFIFNFELDCKDKIFFSFFENMRPLKNVNMCHISLSRTHDLYIEIYKRLRK
jgi:hypothetical protein